MITTEAVTAWSITHPWPSRDQVEQDLILSRAICAIASDNYLGDELVFRGGTALHKLHLASPLRYSEDLDYVRASAGGIGPLTRALTGLGESLGFAASTRISEHPKVYWRTTATSGNPIRIKIEVNTHERSPARPTIRLAHTVDSSWWSGTAMVQTFQTAELVATKIRALYQRKKGRDLFDLWLALTVAHVDPAAIIACFAPYRPHGYTSTLAINNLRTKQNDPTFRTDLEPLITAWPPEYSIDAAADLITETLLAQL